METNQSKGHAMKADAWLNKITHALEEQIRLELAQKYGIPPHVQFLINKDPWFLVRCGCVKIKPDIKIVN